MVADQYRIYDSLLSNQMSEEPNRLLENLEDLDLVEVAHSDHRRFTLRQTGPREALSEIDGKKDSFGLDRGSRGRSRGIQARAKTVTELYPVSVVSVLMLP